LIVDPQKDPSIQCHQAIHLLFTVICVIDHNNEVKKKSQPFASHVESSGMSLPSAASPAKRPALAFKPWSSARSKGPRKQAKGAALTHSTAPSPAFEAETWRRSGLTLSFRVIVERLTLPFLFC
jgi:hypothetical protein